MNFDEAIDKILMLSGKDASRTYLTNTLSNINQAEFQIYSQWGEDGIIEYLIQKIEKEKCIPNIFIELGVENYTESNTRFLLKNRNWTGLVVDGSGENVKYIKSDPAYWRYDLTALEKFITAENIDKTIAECGFAGDIGLLSIDLDGNDYYIWDAIKSITPILVVCEYNALFGDRHELTVPYKADFIRGKEHYSNLYFGASIRALIKKGVEKGYCFLGSCSNGVNAFFVRNDYFSIFKNCLDEYAMHPSKFSESRNEAGQLSYLKNVERIRQIFEMKVFKIDSSSIMKISEISSLYSKEWSMGIKSQFMKEWNHSEHT